MRHYVTYRGTSIRRYSPSQFVSVTARDERLHKSQYRERCTLTLLLYPREELMYCMYLFYHSLETVGLYRIQIVCHDLD